MKNLLLSSAALLVFATTNVIAQSPEITMTDQSFETQICYAAATKGLDSAKALVAEKGLSFRKFEKHVTCNKKDLVSFAKQFENQRSKGEELAQVQLVATNNDVESKICLESLTHGITITAAKYKINKDYVRCNGKPLPRFVNESKRRGATVASLPK